MSGLSFEMKSVPLLHDGIVYINGYGSPLNQPGNQVEVDPFDAVIAANDADGDGRIGADEMPEGRAAAWHGFMDLDADGTLDTGEWQYLRDALASLNGMLAIRAGGEGDRTADAVVWSYRRSVPQLPSPLLIDDVLYMLKINNRTPSFIGDLRAQIGAAQLGARRLREIIDAQGIETVEAAVQHSIDYAARRFRAEVAAWPDGVYEADAWVDHDPVGNQDIRVHVHHAQGERSGTHGHVQSDPRLMRRWQLERDATGLTEGKP